MMWRLVAGEVLARVAGGGRESDARCEKQTPDLHNYSDDPEKEAKILSGQTENSLDTGRKIVR